MGHTKSNIPDREYSPHCYEVVLIDPSDVNERFRARELLYQAASINEIDDFKVLDDVDAVAILLKKTEDWKRIAITLAGVQKVEHEFWSADNINWRKLKVHANEFQKIVDATELKGVITIKYNRTAGSLVAHATDPHSYVKFRELVLGDVTLQPSAEDMDGPFFG